MAMWAADAGSRAQAMPRTRAPSVEGDGGLLRRRAGLRLQALGAPSAATFAATPSRPTSSRAPRWVLGCVRSPSSIPALPAIIVGRSTESRSFLSRAAENRRPKDTRAARRSRCSNASTSCVSRSEAMVRAFHRHRGLGAAAGGSGACAAAAGMVVASDFPGRTYRRMRSPTRKPGRHLFYDTRLKRHSPAPVPRTGTAFTDRRTRASDRRARPRPWQHELVMSHTRTP